MTKTALTTSDIQKISALSKLRLSDADCEKFVVDFGEIVGFVDRLQELDLSGVEPLEQVIGGNTFLREDVMLDGTGVEVMLKNAPDKVQNLVRVPKVVG